MQVITLIQHRTFKWRVHLNAKRLVSSRHVVVLSMLLSGYRTLSLKPVKGSFGPGTVLWCKNHLLNLEQPYARPPVFHRRLSSTRGDCLGCTRLRPMCFFHILSTTPGPHYPSMAKVHCSGLSSSLILRKHRWNACTP